MTENGRNGSGADTERRRAETIRTDNGSKLKRLNGSKLEPDTMSQYINIQCHTTCYPI